MAENLEIRITPEETFKLLTAAEEARELTSKEDTTGRGLIVMRGHLDQIVELDAVIAVTRHVLGIEDSGQVTIVDELLEKGSDRFVQDRREARIAQENQIIGQVHEFMDRAREAVKANRSARNMIRRILHV